MLEELERRNYSESTKRTYVQTIKDLAQYFKPRPPDQLGPADIRQYQAHLFRDRKLSPNTVNQRTGALRFFFITVLKKSWSIAETLTRDVTSGCQRCLASNRWRSSLNPLPLLFTE
jgi:site-specific recombinase XerD